MRFSTIATLLLPALAVAAPLASSSSSSLASASSAAALLKTLNTDLQSSASDMDSTIAKSTDKDASMKAVAADLLKMTNSVQNVAQQMGIQAPLVGHVAKREAAMAVAANADGKVVLHAAEYKQKRSQAFAVAADASGKGFLTAAGSDIEKRSQAMAVGVDADGKTVLHIPRAVEAVVVDAEGKTALHAVEKRSDDAMDLATEMNTAVETVQSAVDNANAKFGANSLKSNTVPLFAGMSSLSSGVVQIVSQA